MKVLVALAVLICAVSAQFAFPFGSLSSGKRCNSVAECSPDECCVHSPLAKRFLFESGAGFLDGFSSLHKHLTSGHCRPLRKENESCIPFGREMSLFNTKAHFAFCPCEGNLECTSDKTVHDHEGGTLETHTNTMCSQPEGSGEEA